MTWREYIIAALSGGIDDGGAAEESVIYYDISCPIRSGSAPCDGAPNITREMCVACKEAWLDSEYR